MHMRSGELISAGSYNLSDFFLQVISLTLIILRPTSQNVRQ